MSWFIQELFLASDYFSKSCVIGLYYPIDNEVQTFRIISRSLSCSKITCLPKIINNQMSFAKFTSYNSLKMGKFGIMEPIGDELIPLNEIDVIVTPGIAFDRFGYRIGYGKGFYDRLFEECDNKNKTFSVGLAYDFQVLSRIIERESHDKKVNAIMTNKESISI